MYDDTNYGFMLLLEIAGKLFLRNNEGMIVVVLSLLLPFEKKYLRKIASCAVDIYKI